MKSLSDDRSWAQIVGAIDGDPALSAFEVIEDALAVDEKVSDEGELGDGFEGDGFIGSTEAFDEGGAGLSDTAVDDHGAGAADFFEATCVPDGRGGFDA